MTAFPTGSAAPTWIWIAPAELGPDARRAFTDLVGYCLPGVDRHFLTPGPRPAVRFTATDEQHAARVRHLLGRAFDRTAGPVPVPRAPLFDQWEPPVPAAAPSGDLAGTGPGLVVGGPATARLFRALDRLFLDLATEAGATEYTVPQMVTWATLDRAGYTRTFPQHLTACGVVGPDLDALDRFTTAEDPDARRAELRFGPTCLAPAVCLHLFARFADTRGGAPPVSTALGTCARYEAGEQGNSSRLWSFTMREIVFVGDAVGAEHFRDRMLQALTDLARRLALPARIVAANDPFFTADRAGLTSYQTQFDVKHELHARMADDGRAVAVSSINFHQQHFGTGFAIGLADGTPAHSVCLGFGLDRWAQWILGYAGDDPTRWPEPLRAPG